MTFQIRLLADPTNHSVIFFTLIQRDAASQKRAHRDHTLPLSTSPPLRLGKRSTRQPSASPRRTGLNGWLRTGRSRGSDQFDGVTLRSGQCLGRTRYSLRCETLLFRSLTTVLHEEMREFVVWLNEKIIEHVSTMLELDIRACVPVFQPSLLDMIGGRICNRNKSHTGSAELAEPLGI